MLTSIATATLLLSAHTQGIRTHDASLTIEKGGFHYSAPGGAKCVEPLVSPTAIQADKVVFRKNSSFAVWDDRGLSVRHKNRTKSYKLMEMALTPKLFSRDEILRTRSLIAKGIRQKAASALSGSKRIGSEAFFLVRWVESTGKPWLEALVKVDLDSDAPKPKLVGKFDGLSLASKPIDDKLFLLAGALCVITRSESGWSLAKYDPMLKSFSSNAQGVGLVSYSPLGRELGIFVEKKQSGAKLIGRVDLATGARRDLYETRATILILDDKRPSIAILNGAILHNLESGVQTPFPADAAVRRTAAGILVWWPKDAPVKALMLDPTRWTQLGKWTKGQEAPKISKPHKHKAKAKLNKSYENE